MRDKEADVRTRSCQSKEREKGLLFTGERNEGFSSRVVVSNGAEGFPLRGRVGIEVGVEAEVEVELPRRNPCQSQKGGIRRKRAKL